MKRRSKKGGQLSIWRSQNGDVLRYTAETVRGTQINHFQHGRSTGYDAPASSRSFTRHQPFQQRLRLLQIERCEIRHSPAEKRDGQAQCKYGTVAESARAIVAGGN